MKVLVINCGSSSLKYQLIDMDGEKVLCKGLCERIGMESSMITHEANGHKATTPAIFPTHTEAFAEVVKKMTTGEGKCINDVSEIDAIGHRVVHGGEKFKESCLITDEVIETIRELSPLAPLHNPAGILGIEAARKVFGNIPMVAVFDTAFHTSLAKGHGALSLGNVIGANVFNLVLVSGVSATVAPFTIPQNSLLFGHNASLVLEFPVMFAVMLLLTLPALFKGKLSRPQGIALLCIYAAFCVVQFTI